MNGSPEGSAIAAQLSAAIKLRKAVDALSFSPPVAVVYNPLDYARRAFIAYVEKFGAGPKRVLFLGMNPGPWGMAQTGVPFGEVTAVRDWMGLNTPVGHPLEEHPAYLVRGMDCPRHEVSGQRLWGLFRSRFGDAEAFFKEHFVVNYCPLLFIASFPKKDGLERGKNLTPDKLPVAESIPLYRACNQHLQAVVEALRPKWVVGIGGFAEARAREALKGVNVKVTRILHPSPASPLSNRDWPGEATRQLVAAGVWE